MYVYPPYIMVFSYIAALVNLFFAAFAIILHVNGSFFGFVPLVHNIGLHEIIGFLLIPTSYYSIARGHNKVALVLLAALITLGMSDALRAIGVDYPSYDKYVSSFLSGSLEGKLHAHPASAICFSILSIFALRNMLIPNRISPIEHFMIGGLVVSVGASPIVGAAILQYYSNTSAPLRLSISGAPVALWVSGIALCLSGCYRLYKKHSNVTWATLLLIYTIISLIALALASAAEIKGVRENNRNLEHGLDAAATFLSGRISEVNRLVLNSTINDEEMAHYSSADDVDGFKISRIDRYLSIDDQTPSPVTSILASGQIVSLDSQRPDCKILALIDDDQLKLIYSVSLEHEPELKSWTVASFKPSLYINAAVPPGVLERVSIRLLIANEKNKDAFGTTVYSDIVPIGINLPLQFQAKSNYQLALADPDNLMLLVLLYLAVYMAMIAIESLYRLSAYRDYAHGAMDTSTAGFVSVASDGEIVESNLAFRKIVGVDSPLYIDSYLSAYRDFLGKDNDQVPATLSIDKDSTCPVLISSNQSVLEGRNITVFTVFDQRPHVQAQKILADEKQKFEILLSSISHGVIGLGPDGLVTYVNKSFTNLLGYAAERVLGLPLNYVLGIAQEELQPILKTLETRAGFSSINQSFHAADGRIIPVTLSVMPTGETPNSGCVILFDDATYIVEQRRIEAEGVATLKRINEELSHFSHMVSHDFKEPSRAVALYCDLAIEQLHDGDIDSANEYLEKIRSAGLRIYSHVNGLLELSNSGQQSIDLAKVDVTGAINHAMSDLHDIIKSSGATIDIQHIPPILASADPLARVFQNFISNSIKFTTPGVSPKIDIWGLEHDDITVSIFIRDNGCGIPSDGRDKIYEPFARLHGSSTYEGSGLGLAIVKTLVTKMHGNISILSTDQTGTTFELVFLSTAATNTSKRTKAETSRG